MDIINTTSQILLIGGPMATEQDLKEFSTEVTCPNDFDEFWTGTLDQLARASLKPAISADPLSSNDDV